MTDLKADWATGDTFTPGDANDVATKVNANTATAAAAASAAADATTAAASAGSTASSAATAAAAAAAAAAGKEAALTPTAVKTGAYTAAVGDLVPVDAVSAPVTITFPTTPADKTRIAVKKIDTSINAVTIAAGGAAVFNKAGGSTTLLLQLANQSFVFQYKASGDIWYVVSTDAPLGGFLTAVSVKNFGAKGDNATNDSAAFQAAYNWASANNGSVYVPKATYLADGLIHRPGVRIFGDGIDQTIIKAVSGSSNDAVLTIDHGVTPYISVCHLSIFDNGNASQHGIHIQARRTGGDSSSGMWHFEFTNVRVYNFALAQMWLEGGGTSSLDPIQFGHMTGLILERQNASANSIGLLMSGQVNQIIWTDCRIDGFGAGSAQAPGVNIKICPQLTSYDVTFDGSTTYASTKAPHTHVFLQCTSQQAVRAAYVYNSASITFDTCHFEGLSSAIEYATAAFGRVDRCHFANSALGATTPYSIRSSGASQVVGRGNYFASGSGLMATTDSGSAYAAIEDCVDASTVSTSNLTRQLNAAATLTTNKGKSVCVVGTGTAIATITSRLMPGEFLTLRCITTAFTLATGGNIDLATYGSPLTVPVGANVVLQRMDRDATWTVVAVNSNALLTAAQLVSINPQTASYTLVAADANKAVEFNSASGVNCTVPLNSTTPFPIGTVIFPSQQGAGTVTVVATGGVTIHTASTLLTRVQFSELCLRKQGTDLWLLTGDMQ